MKLISSQRGEWPTGVYWTPGETRDIDVQEGQEPPQWLTPVKAKKRATKAKEAK